MKKRTRTAAIITASIMMLTLFCSCGEGTTNDTSSTPLASATVTSNENTSATVSNETSSAPLISVPEIVIPPIPLPEKITLVQKGADYKCLLLTTDEFNTYTADHTDWMMADYDRSDWITGEAPLGDRIGGNPIGWGGEKKEPHGLLCVTTFNIVDVKELEGKLALLNIFYDNTCRLYINGTLVFSDITAETGKNDWVDEYTIKEFKQDIIPLLVNGENIVAVSLLDGWGGRELDLEITVS